MARILGSCRDNRLHRGLELWQGKLSYRRHIPLLSDVREYTSRHQAGADNQVTEIMLAGYNWDMLELTPSLLGHL